MKKIDLMKRKIHLETIHDQLLKELMDLDQLMRQVGFTDGLETLKATARDLIRTEFDPEDQDAA